MRLSVYLCPFTKEALCFYMAIHGDFTMFPIVLFQIFSFISRCGDDEKLTPNSSTSACLTPQEMFITNKAITLDGDISKICDQLLKDSKLEYFDLFPGDIC